MADLYSTLVLEDKPLGYWKFNELTGTSITDYGSVGLAMTLQNGATLGQIQGPIAGGDPAVQFNASLSQYAKTISTSSYQTGDTFSLEAWIKVKPPWPNNSIHQTLFAGAAVAGTFKLNLGQSNNLFDCVDQFNAVINHSTTAILNSNWRHIVWTHASVDRVYIDTVDVTATPLATHAFSPQTSEMWIGAKGGPVDPMNGAMAHCAIYNTVLSQTRVTAHYLAAGGGQQQLQTSLLRTRG